MAKRVQIIGNTTANTATFVGLAREITVDTDRQELIVNTGGGAGTQKRIPNKDSNDLLYQTLSTLLTALAAVSATDGLIAKTGAATVSARTITGTSGEVDVANGGGAGGNPTLRLSSTAVLPGSVTATGVFSLSTKIEGKDKEIGRAKLTDFSLAFSSLGSIATTDFNLETANIFSGSVAENCTFTFSNPPATGNAGELCLILTNAGSKTISWPASVKWPGGSAPVLTSSGVDVLVFITTDGGTIWRGAATQLASA